MARSRVYLNGPYTDQRYNDIIAAVQTLDGVYRTRLHVFIELLRHTDMDAGDAVVFRPEMVDADRALRYIRTKTGIRAVIPLSAHMVTLLEAIPLGPTSVPDMFVPLCRDPAGERRPEMVAAHQARAEGGRRD